MAITLGSLLVELKANTASFTDSMNKAQYQAKKSAEEIRSSLDSIGTAVKGVIGFEVLKTGLESIKGLVESSAESAHQIERLSTITGASTEELSRMAPAAKTAGVGIDTIALGMERLSRSAYAANGGNLQLEAAFRTLGVKVTDTNGQLKPMVDLFAQVGAKLAAIDNPTVRAALSLQLMGRSAAQLEPFFALGQEAINKLAADAEKLGAIQGPALNHALESWIPNLARLQLVTQGLGNQLLISLAPGLERATDEIVRLASSPAVQQLVQELGVSLAKGLVAVANGIVFVAEHFEELKTIAETLIALELAAHFLNMSRSIAQVVPAAERLYEVLKKMAAVDFATNAKNLLGLSTATPRAAGAGITVARGAAAGGIGATGEAEGVSALAASLGPAAIGVALLTGTLLALNEALRTVSDGQIGAFDVLKADLEIVEDKATTTAAMLKKDFKDAADYIAGYVPPEILKGFERLWEQLAGDADKGGDSVGKRFAEGFLKWARTLNPVVRLLFSETAVQKAESTARNAEFGQQVARDLDSQAAYLANPGPQQPKGTSGNYAQASQGAIKFQQQIAETIAKLQAQADAEGLLARSTQGQTAVTIQAAAAAEAEKKIAELSAQAVIAKTHVTEQEKTAIREVTLALETYKFAANLNKELDSQIQKSHEAAEAARLLAAAYGDGGAAIQAAQEKIAVLSATEKVAELRKAYDLLRSSGMASANDTRLALLDLDAATKKLAETTAANHRANVAEQAKASNGLNDDLSRQITEVQQYTAALLAGDSALRQFKIDQAVTAYKNNPANLQTDGAIREFRDKQQQIYDVEQQRTAAEKVAASDRVTRIGEQIAQLNLLRATEQAAGHDVAAITREINGLKGSISGAYDATLQYQIQIDQLNQKLKSTLLSEEARVRMEEQLAQLERQQAAVQGGPRAGIAAGLGAFGTQWQGLGRETQDATQNALRGIQGDFTRFFTSVASGTKSLGKTFAEFGRGILISLTESLAEMLAKWTLTHFAMGAISSIFHIKDAAETAAAATAKTAVQIPTNVAQSLSSAALGAVEAGASVAAIPYVGWAMVPEVVASTYALLAGFSSLAALAAGGQVSGPGTSTSDSIPAMLSSGEFVVRAAAVDKIGVSTLEAINRGQMTAAHMQSPQMKLSAGGAVFAQSATALTLPRLSVGGPVLQSFRPIMGFATGALVSPNLAQPSFAYQSNNAPQSPSSSDNSQHFTVHVHPPNVSMIDASGAKGFIRSYGNELMRELQRQARGRNKLIK